MSIIQGVSSGSAVAPFYGFNIGNSLRFNDDDTAFLSRTLADGGAATYTLSLWIKRANISIDLAHIYGAIGNSGDDYELMRFNSSDQINWQLRDSTLLGNVTTDAVFRDVSAWYNIVFYRSGSTVRIYVNGVEQALTTGTSYSSTVQWANNNTYENRFGVRTDGASGKFDGYMAEINFIDGSALTPASFGETKNDIWVAKDTSGLTYGANGFRLQFKNSATGTASSSTVGADTGGNNLHFTSSGIATTDQMLDSPTNNHNTLNSIQGAHGTTLSDGNLKVVVPDNKSVGSTIAPTSGKWYAEVTVNSADFVSVGVCEDGQGFGVNLNASSKAYMYSYVGTVFKKGVADTNPATFGATDKIGIFLDLDNHKLYFKKNNTGITTSEGQHSVGSTGITIDSGHGYYFAVTSNGNSADCTFNFGQTSFTYSPDGGHEALNTANLPDPAIDPNDNETPDQYFDTTTYTANNGTLSITGLEFQPDFVWIKSRSLDIAHAWFDVLRGTATAGSTNTAIGSNRADAEGNGNGVLSAFTSDGFTVAGGSSGSNPRNLVNKGTNTYVAWTWKAGGAPSADNSAGVGATPTAGSVKIDGANLGSALAGTLAATRLTANTEAGFSIVTFTLQSTGSKTVAHGLSSAPEMIIFKSRSNNTNWIIQHVGIADADPFTDFISFTTAAASDNATVSDDTAPTNSVFTIGSGFTTGNYGANQVAYCFHSVDGFSKFGSYEGNDSTDNTFVFTGFRPRFLMIKNVDSTGNWGMWDTARTPSNVAGSIQRADQSHVENTTSPNNDVDILSNGFKIRGNTSVSGDAVTYLYMAIAEQPFKYSNAR